MATDLATNAGIRTVERPKRIFLLDGHSLSYRAFFALPPSLATTSGQICRVAATPRNLMPVLLEAAEARCSVGEITNALAEVFGRYDGAAKW